jgi:hypothetical protein
MRKITNVLFYTILVAAVGCKPYEFQPEETRTKKPTKVEAPALDFTSYVAFGGSFTSGYMDDALYTEGQKSAYPNFLYKAFQKADTTLPQGDLPFPDVGTEIGWTRVIVIDGPPLVSYNVGRLRFDNPHPRPLYETGFQGDGPGCFPLVAKPMESDKTPAQYFARYTQPFNNFGVPGLTMLQALSTATSDVFDVLFNPYYLRIASRPRQSSVLQDAAAKNPTFFSIMLGESDIVNYMRSGGKEYLATQIDYELQIRSMIEELGRNGAKGVILTLPEFTDFPYFTSATEQAFYRPFELNTVDANDINRAYFLQGYPQRDYFKAGLNTYLVERGNGILSQFIPGVELVTSDFIPFLDSLGRGEIVKCGITLNGRRRGMGIIHEVENVLTQAGVSVPKAYPVPDKYVLDVDELSFLSQRLRQYNTSIRNIQSQGTLLNIPVSSFLALADLNFEMNLLKRDRGQRDGDGFIVMYYDQGPAGFFSSDGIHPSPKGQAFIANVAISAINRHFGSNLEQVDIKKVRGNTFEARP